jgi:hypothetical protein
VTDPLATFRASASTAVQAPESWGFNGVSSLTRNLKTAKSLVTVGPVGLEPTTYGLKVFFSTDWAMPTCPV